MDDKREISLKSSDRMKQEKNGSHKEYINIIYFYIFLYDILNYKWN